MMLFKDLDLSSTAYKPISSLTVIKTPSPMDATGAAVMPANRAVYRSTRENLVSRVATFTPPSTEMLQAVQEAIARMDARKSEDLQQWADALAKDLGAHTD